MRLVKNLNPDELKKVLENNRKLTETITDILLDRAQMEVQDILSYFKDTIYNYSIGNSVYRNYIKVEQAYYSDFLEAVETSDYCFSWFADERNCKLFERLKEKADFFEECICGYADISESRFEHLEKWFDEGVEAVAAGIVAETEYLYDVCYEPDEIESYFAECYIDEHPAMYIDSDYHASEPEVKRYW